MRSVCLYKTVSKILSRSPRGNKQSKREHSLYSPTNSRPLGVPSLDINKRLPLSSDGTWIINGSIVTILIISSSFIYICLCILWILFLVNERTHSTVGFNIFNDIKVWAALLTLKYSAKKMNDIVHGISKAFWMQWWSYRTRA